MRASQRCRILLALVVALTAGGGCQSARKDVRPAATAPKREQIRVNCYSLLHDLLDQQKNVDKLLLIKRESAELNRLIKTIASASASGAKTLEQFAAYDRSFDLDQLSLPVGETETRAAIAATKANQLLTSSGANFELNLLLTQAQALSYAWHLSKVASANESQPARAQYFAALSEEMRTLHQETLSLMRSRLATIRKTNS